MKFSLIIFLPLISLTAATIQISGTWYSDWQNPTVSSCSPSSFTLTQLNTTTLNITYTFPLSTIQTFCTSFNITSTFSSLLTQTAGSNTWTDSLTSQQMIYNASTNTFLYLTSNTTFPQLLYTTNGASVPEFETLAYIGGSWSNPVPVDPSDISSGCCVPSSLVLGAANGTGLGIDTLRAALTYTEPCANSPTESFFLELMPNAENVTWVLSKVPSDLSDQSDLSYLESKIVFSPLNSTTQVMLSINAPLENNTCNFYYEKFAPTTLISGTWKADWQTARTLNTLTLYQVTKSNNSIMTSMSQYGDQNFTGFLFQASNGLYFDPDLVQGIPLAYDEKTNTLLSTGESPVLYGSGNLLLSPTGSLFPYGPFIAIWNNSQSVSGEPMTQNYFCCVPISMTIQNYSVGTLTVVYNYPEVTSDDYPTCYNFDYIQNNQIISTLYVVVPSIEHLVFTDMQGNHTVYFGNTTDRSTITIENYFGQCTFNMKFASTIPIPLQGLLPSPSLTPFPPISKPLIASFIGFRVFLVTFVVAYLMLY